MSNAVLPELTLTVDMVAENGQAIVKPKTVRGQMALTVLEQLFRQNPSMDHVMLRADVPYELWNIADRSKLRMLCNYDVQKRRFSSATSSSPLSITRSGTPCPCQARRTAAAGQNVEH